MRLRPLYDRILVKPVAEKEPAQGDPLVPEPAREKPLEGRVIAVGEGMLRDDGTLRPLSVHHNDRVLFSRHSGAQVQYQGDEHLIIREGDVLAVLY